MTDTWNYQLSEVGVSLELVPRTSCYLCHTDLDNAVARQVRTLEPLTAGVRQRVLICPACGLGHSDPHVRESDVAKLYETEIPTASDGKMDMARLDFDTIRGTWIDRAKDWRARRSVGRHVREHVADTIATVVDFAAGNGRYAVAAHRVLPEARVIAVDYQSTPPPGLREGILYIPVDEFFAGAEKADVIWLRQVLEHSPDPVQLLSSLAVHLTPSGFIYVEVPNVESAMARVFRSRWLGYYLPRHIFHYGPGSLEKILSAAGLSGDIRGCELPSMGYQIADLLGATKYRPTHQILGAIAFPIQLLIAALGRSSGCIYTIARK